MYKPHDPRYARALGRFPKRNRFISDYIYDLTGVRRSPKQVGSRLQQLKDVACGKKRKYHNLFRVLLSFVGNSFSGNCCCAPPLNLVSSWVLWRTSQSRRLISIGRYRRSETTPCNISLRFPLNLRSSSRFARFCNPPIADMFHA